MLFSQPAFLWGLLAVAIPIIVHLFNFRRYRKVYFSNVERLNELHTEQRRHSTLRQWLVLAMRILAVVFLVLAFAQPVIPSSKETLRTGSTVISLYVDNSFSMENAGADGSLLDVARQKVREVVEAYSVSDRYQLITNDMRGSEMRWLNRDELLAALDELTASPAAPLMSEVAARQCDFMHQCAADNRHAYIISDFQQTIADFDVLPVDSLVRFTLVPLAAVEADNLFVDTVVLDAPAYFAGGSVSVEITLRNSGSRNAEKVPVKLLVDGRERAVATVDIAADGSAKTMLRFSLDRTGWVDGCVVIEDYPVTFDDSYYFSFFVDDRIRVLELDGTAPNAFLQRLFGSDTTVQYQCAKHLQHDLSQFDFVMLNELRSLSSGEAQQLAEWVGEGGSLLVIPPTDGDVQGVNALLSSLQAPQLGRWAQRQVKASSVDYGGALYRGVFNGSNDEMEMPVVQGHYTYANSQAVRQPLIVLSDGGDLLSATSVGEGLLYLFTTPLDAEQTNFVNQALFVPTLYNMALYSRPQPPASHLLGSHQVALQGTYSLGERPPELTDGRDLHLLPDLRCVGNRWQLLLHGELVHDGIYTLGDEHLAFNYPRRESQMTFLDRDAIAKAIAGRENCSLLRNTAKPITDELRARDGGRQLWRFCILLALVALLVETILLKTKH